MKPHGRIAAFGAVERGASPRRPFAQTGWKLRCERCQLVRPAIVCSTCQAQVCRDCSDDGARCLACYDKETATP